MVVPEPPTRVQTHVDTSDFERRAEDLGAEVGLADEQLEARLHAKFDHRLGSLDDNMPATGSADVPAEARQATLEIAQLLANPNSLRNAVVLSEILTPAHHRW
jgi:hypothetical protein